MARSSSNLTYHADLRRWWTFAGLALVVEVLVLFGLIAWLWISDWSRHAAAAGGQRVPSAQVTQSPTMVAPVPPSAASELPASRRVASVPSSSPALPQPRVELPADDRVAAAPAPPAAVLTRVPITRIVIPSIGVDRAIESVAPTIEEEAYGPVQVWPVPTYAVGHHADSGLPGDQTNIVLTGHVGGSDPVFAQLIDLTVGDVIVLYQETTPVTYTVQSNQRLQEVGVPLVQQQENAQVLDPTPTETLTVITCWPPAGPNAYDQRVVVRAVPAQEQD